MNEIIHHLNDRIWYLEITAELLGVYSSIEKQSAETNPWKSHIPTKAQICS